jgi:predicted ATPase
MLEKVFVQWLDFNLMKSLPSILLNSKNESVLAYLNDGRSCHSDIVDPFYKVMKSYETVQWCLLNSQDASPAIWYSGDEIIAFAAGMQNIGVKLKTNILESKFEGLQASEIGECWYLISYNTNKWPEIASLIVGIK